MSKRHFGFTFLNDATFLFLTEAMMEFQIFWDVTPGRLINTFPAADISESAVTPSKS
jgi:hypothetical protein